MTAGWRDELAEAERLLAALRARGVAFEVGNQRVAVEADEGALDKREWDDLARLKSALLVLLYREQDRDPACHLCGGKPANWLDDDRRRYCRRCYAARPGSPYRALPGVGPPRGPEVGGAGRRSGARARDRSGAPAGSLHKVMRFRQGGIATWPGRNGAGGSTTTAPSGSAGRWSRRTWGAARRPS